MLSWKYRLQTRCALNRIRTMAEPKPKEVSDGEKRSEEGPQSKVETAGPGDACKEKSGRDLTHPLSLSWSFGFNPSLPVHNVSEGTRKMMFYICSHTGVLYDCVANRQCPLQGHGYPITCTAVSGDRRWLVTADVGPECMLIVWDSFSAIPVRTIFEGLGQGCLSVAMSDDARYVATLSAGVPQVVCVWEWTIESNTPLCQTTLSTDFGQQTQLVFSSEDSSQLASTSEDQVIFYSWHGTELKTHSTPVTDKDFNKPVGVYSQTVFVPGSTRALTGTSEGCGVVWQDLKEGFPRKEPHVKKPLKLKHMHDSPISCVTVVESLVVTGDSIGCIKFFDSDLKLINWYDSAKLGPLTSISFAHVPTLTALKKETTKENEGDSHFYPPESTMVADPFVIPDFTISTTTASIAHVTTNGSTTDVVFCEHDAAVSALTAHPTQQRLLIGSYSCKLKLWDYEKKEVLAVRDFEEPNYIQCVTFDPKGEVIGIGFTNGVVGVLDATTLEDVCQPFRYARDCVTHITFSHDSHYMATADLDLCVTVYVTQPENEQQPWQFLAKHRAHYKQIEGLIFGVMLDSSAPRLLSVARDRTLVEYDLEGSGVDDLRLMSVDHIEQSAVPTAMVWYPPLTKESFLMVAGDQYKLKLYNSTTKMCRKTLLGPTFGNPIRKMVVLPGLVVRTESGEERRRYLAYTTTDKVGLLLLPHDGNPHNSMCLIAHPIMVTDMTCSHDGRYIFTAGGEDCTVNMWTVNTDALEAASLLGGEDLSPFYAMLEGGREGEFFAELEDYFYYAQIRSQGPDTVSTRNASVTVPLDQIPYIMRAVGFFPSEQQIEDMLNEVKFSKYVDTGTYVTEIDLGDFIRLYINHRPVFGLSPVQLARAFHVLGQREGGEQEWAVRRGKLLTLLQEKGEHMTETELVECLMTLLGYSENPEAEGTFSENADTALQELPQRITATQFAEELLGLST